MKRSVQLFGRIVFLGIGFLIVILSLSCTDKPDAKWDNPVDPENPDTHGDPYLLQLQIANGGIHLTWNALQSLPVSKFNVYRRVDEAGSFTLLTDVTGANEYTDTSVLNGKKYEYYVVSVNARGEEADISNIASMKIHSHPVFVIEGDSVNYIARREVNLTILAFGAAKMRLANDESFSGSEWIDHQNIFEWTLTSGAGTKTVYLQMIYADGDTSEVVFDTIEPSPINASVIINDGDDLTNTRHITLTLEATGVDSVYVSNDPIEGLPGLSNDPEANSIVNKNDLDESAGWMPMASSMNWDLATGEGTKTAYVLFRNDFMVDTILTDMIDPAPLNLSMEIDDGAESTANKSVNIKLIADGGYQMEVINEDATTTSAVKKEIPSGKTFRKESINKTSFQNNGQDSKKQLNFNQSTSSNELDSQEEWVDYDDDFNWDLTTGTGQKTVTVKVRNDFLIEDDAVDSIMPRYPADYGFEILSPDTTTRNTITIAFQGTDVDSIMIATQANLSDGVWIAFADTVLWNLQGFLVDGSLVSKSTKKSIVSKSLSGRPSTDELDAVHYELFFQFKNSFEVLSEVLSGEVTVDIPSSLEINRGNPVAASRFASLTLLSDDADQMAFDTSLWQLEHNPQWRDYYNNIDNFQLRYGPGTKTVFARFKNSSGAESEIVSDDIEPIELNPSFTINNGQDSTATRIVPLYPSGQGVNVQWMFSEDINFEDAQWHPMLPMENITLSFIPGETTTSTRTVYARIKNDFEIISPLLIQEIQTDSIHGSLDLVSDYLWTNIPEVRLEMFGVRATQMILSTEADSTGLPWELYRPVYDDYPLSVGDGTKYVYAWFRNEFYAEGPYVDSTGLDTQVEIASFSWTGTALDTVREGEQLTFTMVMTDDGFGSEVNGQATVTVPGMLFQYPLNDNGDGSYSVTLTVTDDMQAVRDAEVIGSFTDRAGNIAEEYTADGTITYWVDPGTVSHFALGNTGITIPMIWIAPGSFNMGAYPGEQEARNVELPQHLVTLETGFWLSVYEVTQDQWTAVAGYNPSFFGGNLDNPVEQVSWSDVHEDFINVLNESDPDDAWRLPSESEWEFAARAGTDTRYYWGDDPDSTMIDDYAWNLHNCDATQAVGQKIPNAWGLYDVQGNVNEWVEDWYHDSYTGAPDDGNPWLDPPFDTRVTRGGNWNSRPRHCRAASRSSFTENYRGHFVGVRIARSAL